MKFIKTNTKTITATLLTLTLCANISLWSADNDQRGEKRAREESPETSESIDKINPDSEFIPSLFAMDFASMLPGNSIAFMPPKNNSNDVVGPPRKKSRQSTYTGEKPHACRYCDYKTAQKGHITEHERTHTGEKPYACRYCDYKAAQQCTLKAHERTHTGEKPYACRYCDYKATQQYTLKAHERTHTGEKPYACSTAGCDYKAAFWVNLTRHERTHSYEKPYACSTAGCAYKAARKDNLKAHEMTHAQPSYLA